MWPFRAKKNSDEIHKKQLNAFGPLAIVSSMCMGTERERLPVMHGVRHKPNNIADSGWILSSGRESKQFVANSRNYHLVPLGRMIDADSTLGLLGDLPIGSEITRREISERWRFIVNDQVVDEDGKVVGEAIE